jgi:hypothetical protein
LKEHIAGRVSQIIEEPETWLGFSKNDARVRALTALQENQAAIDSFTLAIAESAEYYQTHGYRGSDNRLIPLKDRAVAMEVALVEQLKGVKLVAEGGWFGRDIGQFIMQPKGSLQPKVVEELKEQAKLEDEERDSVPDVDLSEVEKEERELKQAKSEKALRNFEMPQNQEAFKKLSLLERTEFLDKFENIYGIRPIVDSSLITPTEDISELAPGELAKKDLKERTDWIRSIGRPTEEANIRTLQLILAGRPIFPADKGERALDALGLPRDATQEEIREYLISKKILQPT